MRFRQLLCGVLITALLSGTNIAWAKDAPAKAKLRGAPAMLQQKMSAPMVERYLLSGKLADGETALVAQLKTHPHDDQARFGLGVLQFLRAVERLSQDMYRFGLRGFSPAGGPLAVARVQLKANPNPEELTYPKAREIAKTFQENLEKAQNTLAQISDPDVKLPLHFGLIRLDLDGDGLPSDNEMLWKLYNAVSRNNTIESSEAENFYIKFDRGDVHWLRGYCHLIMTICDVYLAYDSKETFDRTAQLFFAKVRSPYPFLNKSVPVGSTRDTNDILDFVAFIHTIRWPVCEPERMASALHHLEAVVAQSKQSWRWIMAETDDDHEWIPNPRQTGVLPNMKVTDEMVTTWLAMMDDIDDVLKGSLLIPFWRGDRNLGVNVRQVFLQPTPLDLVLWIQGSAAGPYLQKGPMTHTVTWRRLNDVFGGDLPGFAIWFN